MLEKTILNVAINIIYLGPSINGVDWFRDFTNKLYSTLASTVICGLAFNGSSLNCMRTRDKACLYMHSFIFFMYRPS